MIRKSVSNFTVEVRGRSSVGDILKNKYRKGWTRQVPITSTYESKEQAVLDQKNIIPSLTDKDPLQERLSKTKSKRIKS